MNNFNDILNKVKDIANIEQLNPMQNQAINEIYDNHNIIVSSPTSSGKTFVAEVYAINCALRKRKRVIYLCPLKALASEHYKSFKRKYEQFDLKIALSTGDLDSSSKILSNYHIIFLTYEKLDSLIRHKTEWLNSVGLVIIDEIHMIDSDRGPTLETAIVQLQLLTKANFLGLSATIPNASQLANWLNAKLIESNFRPVRLRKGIMINEKISFDDQSSILIDSAKDELIDLVEDTMKINKQMLIFANTRKSAESIAKKLSANIKRHINANDLKHLEKITNMDIENYTNFDLNILDLIKNGIAFHHAGLRAEIRELIEEEFRNGKIKVIVSTPTLSIGLNLPAYRVLIQSIYRHSESGMKPIPIKEYHQMAGRAGRKGFDYEGQAIIIAKNDTDADALFEKYIYAEPEEVLSQLGNVPTLRMIILGLIANDTIFNDKSLVDFFNKTFYAICFNNNDELNYKIYKVLEELIEFGFVKAEKNIIKATDTGKRISELYIDPLSAYNMISKLKQIKDIDINITLMIITNTYELKPYFRPAKDINEQIEQELQIKYDDYGISTNEIHEDWEIVDKFFTALILNDWINEITEQDLMDKYNVLPGILHNKIKIAEWMAYALSQIAETLNNDLAKKIAERLQKRLIYGIKDDLMLLVELPNIGRIRARKLASKGIRTINDLVKADHEIVSNIVGSKIAIKLYEHLKIPHNIKEKKEHEQKNLFSY